VSRSRSEEREVVLHDPLLRIVGGLKALSDSKTRVF
jgi:hypothetical protein